MKKIVLSAFAGLLSLTGYSSQLNNGGFEQEWSGWSKSAGANVPVKWEISEQEAHSGKKSLRISFADDRKPGVYATMWQNVPVAPDTDYIIRLWIKAEGAQPIVFGGGKKWEIRTLTKPGTYDWTEYTCKIKTGLSDNIFTVRIIIENRVKNAWIDDISIERVYEKLPSSTYSVIDSGAIPDGKTDCTDAFNKALKSGYSTIYVPHGKYALTSVRVPTGVTLIGGGADSLIIPYPEQRIQSNKDDDNKLQRDESAPQKLFIINTGSEIKNLRIDCLGEKIVAISSNRSSNVLVENCNIVNSKSFGIHFNHVNFSTIRNNTISRAQRAINIDFSNNIRVAGNNVSDCFQHGIQFWGNYNWQEENRCSNMIFSDNIVKNGGAGAIWGCGYTDVIMNNNLIDGAEDVGLDLEWVDNAVITGNVVKNAKNGGIALFFRCRRVTISGNTVINNWKWDEDPKDWWVRAGIWLTYPNSEVYKQDTGHEDINITGNTIFNDSGMRRAIWIGSESKRVGITNCNFNKDLIYFGGTHKKSGIKMDTFKHCPVYIDSASQASDKLK